MNFPNYLSSSYYIGIYALGQMLFICLRHPLLNC
jgi:hypothetical protein